MSIFFGIFRPQGGPVDPKAFEDMCRASKREDFDGMQSHMEDKIAVGHLMLRVSPEDKYDQQPLKSSCGRYLLVGHFRLDYRDELGDKIGLTNVELEMTSDSRLVMMAYKKWGDKCVNHIHGDWAFIVFDNINMTLSLFKDQFGNSAIFYGQFGNEILFSSDPCIFLELNDRYSFALNDNAFQRIGIEGLEVNNDETFLKNFFSLANSTFLTIGRTLSINKFTYHQILNRKIRYFFELDYILQFHSLIHSSVRSRLRATKIGLFLSAGLDSTMISFFTSKELEYQKKRLSTYTSYPYYINQFSKVKQLKISERSYVFDFVSKYNNIDAEFHCFPNFQHNENLLGEKSRNILYPVVTSNLFWLQGINKSASENGVSIMFNGQMGNYISSWSAPFSSFDSLLKFRFSILFRTYIQKRKVSNTSLFRFVYLEIVKSLYFIVRNKKNRILHSLFKKIPSTTFIKTDIKALKIDFSKEYHHLFSSVFGSAELRSFLFTSYVSRVGQLWYVNSNDSRMLSVDPFTDANLVDYSFSIPEYLFNSFGDKKYIYKKLMQGVIDEQSVYKVSGIPQSFDLGRRLQNDYSFKKLIEDSLTAEVYSKYFDYDYIRNLLEKLNSDDKDILLNQYGKELLKYISLYLFAGKFAHKGLTD